MLHIFIAFRYLKSTKDDKFVSVNSWISFIGIAMGVAVLIIVMSVMNGFRKEIVSKITGFNGHISVITNNYKNYNELANSLSKFSDNIEFVSPVISDQALVSNNGYASGALIKSIAADNINKVPSLKNAISNRSIERYRSDEGIIIGKQLALRLGINLGSKVDIVSPKGYTTIVGYAPKIEKFKVIGFLSSGMYEYDNSVVIMPFVMASSFLSRNNNIDKIEIFVKDISKINTDYINISNQYRGLQVRDWRYYNGSFVDAIDIERNVMFLILSLLVCIAALNIISSMIMLVNSKKPEIAIMQAMGITKKSIIYIFLIIGTSIGVFGSFIGFILGITFSYYIENIQSFVEGILGVSLFSKEVYFLSSLPSEINVNQVLGIVTFAVIGSILSAIYPAIKASKVDPAKALKYE